MKNINTLTLLIVSLLCLGGGFFGGMRYQSGKKISFVNQFNQRNRDQVGQTGPRTTNGSQVGQARGGINRPIVGEILSSDSQSITVKMNDGGSKIVLLSSTTQINKAQSALTSDLKVGELVSVFGQINADGSVIAQNIQLNPQARTATPSAFPGK